MLAGGFAFPVLNLFFLQARNFLAGQTSIERLGKQQGKKIELETMFNVNEPLLNPATPLVETRFLYREFVKEAAANNEWRSQGIQMLPVDPAFSTAQNCFVMCC